MNRQDFSYIFGITSVSLIAIALCLYVFMPSMSSASSYSAQSCSPSGNDSYSSSSSSPSNSSCSKPERSKDDDDDSSSSISFRHESDVHNYLRNHNFVNDRGDITLTEGYGMSLIANGKALTGAIAVRQFNAHQAYFTANSPFNGETLRMVVDNQKGSIYCQNDGTTYYVR